MRGEIYTFHFNFQFKPNDHRVQIHSKCNNDLHRKYNDAIKILHEISKSSKFSLICITQTIHIDTTVWIALCIWIHLDTKTFYMNPFVKETISTLYRKLTILDNFWSIQETFFPPHNNCNCSTSAASCSA